MTFRDSHKQTPWERLYDMEAELKYAANSKIKQQRLGNSEAITSNAIGIEQFGLLQALTALPDHYLDMLTVKKHDHDDTLKEFIHIFNQRIIELSYLAWKKSRLNLAFNLNPNQNTSKRCLSSLSGQYCGESSAIPIDAKIYYSQLLINKCKHASGLARLLQDYFSMPVTIEQNKGQWLDSERTHLTTLSRKHRQNSLGKDTFIGTRHWVCQYKIRIKIGPLTMNEYTDMLPEQSGFNALIEWIKLYCPKHLEFDIQPILHKDDIPKAILMKGNTQRLGYTYWLSTQKPQNHSKQLILGDYHAYA